MESIVLASKRKINYVIDPRIELLSIIQVLSGETDENNIFNRYYSNNDYLSLIKNKFYKYRNHPVISLFNQYKKEGHYLGNSFILKYKIHPFLSLTSNDNETAKNLEQHLIDFAKLIDFESFFLSQKEYYFKVLNTNVNKLANAGNYFQELCDYYQINDYEINIIFKCVQSDWAENITTDNVFNNVCGVINYENNLPIFANSKNEQYLIFHECSHPFVAKAFENSLDFFTKTEILFINLEDNFAKREYPYYNMYLEETFVRAITLYLSFLNNYLTKEEYQKQQNSEMSQGFIFIHDICSLLEQFNFLTSVEKFKEIIIEKVIKLPKNTSKITH